MGNCDTHSHWALLPSEIWSTILLQVLNKYKRLQAWGSDEIIRLSVICTSLHSILQNQACLHEQILLRKLSSTQIPSLLAYIHRHGHAVTEYQEYSTNSDETCQYRPVLAALLALGAPLHTIMLPNPHSELYMVSAFQMLRHCSLKCTYVTGALDLEPLRALPNLQHLTLQYGSYDNVQAAAIQLTTLELSHCTADCTQQCQCVTLLEVLNIEYATLYGLHMNGLLACSQLKALKCICSSVMASNPRYSFDLKIDSQWAPTGLTALTRLTNLEVAYGADDAVSVGMDWVTQVQSLQVLRLKVVCQHLVLTETLSRMTNIRSLHIITNSKHGIPRGTEIHCMLDWSALVSLKEIHLFGTLVFSGQHRLSKLARLPFLHTIGVTRTAVIAVIVLDAQNGSCIVLPMPTAERSTEFEPRHLQSTLAELWRIQPTYL